MSNYKVPGPRSGDKGWVGPYQCERVRTGLVREIPRGEFADPQEAQRLFDICANNGARYQRFVSKEPVCRAIRQAHLDGRKPQEVCPYLSSRTVDQPIGDNDVYRYFVCTKEKHVEGQKKQPKGIWNFWGLLPS